MALERGESVVAIHAVTVIGDRDPLLARALERHLDPLRLGVERVVDQLLQDRSRTLDDLPGRDLVDDPVRKHPDPGAANHEGRHRRGAERDIRA